MTEFAEAHQGDTIHLRGRLIPPLAREKVWAQALLLVTEPAPCGDPGCLALRCVALTSDGRRVFLHRRATREIDVLQHGPASELATHSGDVLAEHVDKPSVGRWSRAAEPDSFAERGDYTDTPNDEGDDQR